MRKQKTSTANFYANLPPAPPPVITDPPANTCPGCERTRRDLREIKRLLRELARGRVIDDGTAAREV